MNKLLKISTAVFLLFISQQAFSQEINNSQQEKTLDIKGLKSKRNVTEKTIVYEVDVSFKSYFITFDKADKVVVYENSGTLKIYNCKNLKIISLNKLIKPDNNKRNYIAYNYKENTLTY